MGQSRAVHTQISTYNQKICNENSNFILCVNAKGPEFSHDENLGNTYWLLQTGFSGGVHGGCFLQSTPAIDLIALLLWEESGWWCCYNRILLLCEKKASGTDSFKSLNFNLAYVYNVVVSCSNFSTLFPRS